MATDVFLDRAASGTREARHAHRAGRVDAHDSTVDDPPGTFRPPSGIADAPSTLEKLDAPESPAEGGFTTCASRAPTDAGSAGRQTQGVGPVETLDSGGCEQNAF